MEETGRVSAGGFVQATARCNVHRLLLLRNFTIIGLSLAIVLQAAGRIPAELSIAVLGSVAAYLAIFNLATFWRLGQAWRVRDLELLAHVFSDIVALAVLLYCSGGTASPFIGLLLVFVAIAALLRDQSRILAEARQREINHDYLVRVGSLAAGAAHEIRSSLSTMAVLAKDLLREGGNPKRDLHLISEQIEACRRSLSDLMIGRDVAEPDCGACESVQVFLRGVLDRWEVLRPGAKVALRWRGTQPPPSIPADRCLGQAILNLLDNAADSAPDQDVEMNCSWSTRYLRILIQDRGPGLQSSVARAEPGQRLLTTKGEKGTGIGLLLAKTAIQRFGGSLRLSNRSGGGARARVLLPIGIAQEAKTPIRLLDFLTEANHAKPKDRSADSAARGR